MNTIVDLIITYEDVKSKAMQLLSVLGKRTIGENGDSQFTRVQVGKAEEPLLVEFAKKATHDVLEKISPCVFDLVEDADGISCKVSYIRWNRTNEDSTNTAFAGMVSDYCSSVTISDYLSLYFPQHSQFFRERAVTIMASILSVCYNKRPHLARGSYYDSTTCDAIDEEQ